MTEIARDDLVPQLRKLFGFRGNAPFELADFVIPTVNLSDVDSPPFHSKKGFAMSGNSAAVAGNVQIIGLFLPAGTPPEARIVIRQVWVGVNAAVPGPVTIAIGPQALWPTVVLIDAAAVGSWDSLPGAIGAGDRVNPLVRQGFITTLAAPGPVNNSQGLGLAVPGETAAGGQTMLVPGPWVLTPGNIFVVMNQTVNQGLRCAFVGDEYYVG